MPTSGQKTVMYTGRPVDIGAILFEFEFEFEFEFWNFSIRFFF
jgi:hypothetical protein